MQEHLIPVYDDPKIVEFADKQLHIFWTHNEIKVEKDIQDVLTNFSEAEKHAALTVLKLFSLYETNIGDEYWGGRFKNVFKSADYHRMASVFTMFELAVHAPFYNKINELLYVNTPEFYLSYKDTEVLKERMEFIGKAIDDEDDLVSVGAFSMVEGAVLYSSFAYLKHYQSQGKNKLMNVVRGLNLSCRDEQIHSEASAYAFKKAIKDRKLTDVKQKVLADKLKVVAEKIYEHEAQINSLLFAKGSIEGITEHQLNCFTKSRLNTCMIELGLGKVYDVTYNPIADWFYKGINDYQFNDFFSGGGREYNRNWDENSFIWKGK